MVIEMNQVKNRLIQFRVSEEEYRLVSKLSSNSKNLSNVARYILLTEAKKLTSSTKRKVAIINRDIFDIDEEIQDLQLSRDSKTSLIEEILKKKAKDE